MRLLLGLPALGLLGLFTVAAVDNAPNLPLIGETLAFGLDVRVDTAGTEARTPADSYAFASRVLRLDMKPKTWVGVTLALKKAWEGAALAHPGDLEAFRNGALVFHVRGDNSGEFFDIGFASGQPGARPQDAPKVEGLTTLPIRPYCWVGPEWQKVIIPIADFPREGYGWKAEGITEGKPEGPRVRVAGPSPWHDAAYLYIGAPQTLQDARILDIANLSLKAVFDPAELQSLRQAAVDRAASSMRGDSRLIFEDTTISGFWAWPPHKSTYVILDEVMFKTGKKSAHFTMQSFANVSAHCPLHNLNHALIGTTFPELDLAPIHERGGISFWLKGKNGGEHFKIGLLSLKTPSQHVMLDGPDIRVIEDVTTEWKKIFIPFADFQRRALYWSMENHSYTTFEWSRVTDLFFYTPPHPEEEWQFYVDEIRFAPNREKS